MTPEGGEVSILETYRDKTHALLVRLRAHPRLKKGSIEEKGLDALSESLQKAETFSEIEIVNMALAKLEDSLDGSA